MRIPDSLASLADYGIIEEVLRPLMSGKEAQIYLVISGGQQRVAKVYKEAQNRTFKNRAEYTEGRKVRNSRDQRAMGKNSRHGRAQAESAWRTTEVEMIYRLRDAGVRVPTPYHFIDSVLVMEMITDAEGNPAPRLGDLSLEPAEAQVIFDRLLSEVVRMLATGVVHGDLSDFNVLMGVDGPVVIDFPQAVDASSNQNARKLLIRDVDNLHRFMARFAPEHKALPYAQEMWALYERSMLAPDTKLSGRHQASERKVNTSAVLDLIGDAAHDERRKREGMGLKMRGAAADLPIPERSRPGHGQHGQARERTHAGQSRPSTDSRPAQQRAPAATAAAAPTARRVEVVVPQRAPRNAPPPDAPKQGLGDRWRPRPQPQEQAQSRPAQRAQARPQPQAQDRSQQQAQARPAQQTQGRSHQQAHTRPQPQAQDRSQQHAQPRPAHATTDAAASSDAVKRRRRRRRHKPGPDAPKTPTQ